MHVRTLDPYTRTTRGKQTHTEEASCVPRHPHTHTPRWSFAAFSRVSEHVIKSTGLLIFVLLVHACKQKGIHWGSGLWIKHVRESFLSLRWELGYSQWPWLFKCKWAVSQWEEMWPRGRRGPFFVVNYTQSENTSRTGDCRQKGWRYGTLEN